MNFKENLNVLRARFIIGFKMYFRYPLNIVFSLIDPVIWLTPFYFMMKGFSVGGRVRGFENYAGNSDVTGFLVVGFMISNFIGTAMWGLGYSLKNEMMQGVLESNWSTPSSKISLLIGRSLFSFVASIFEVVLTGVICHFLFGFTVNHNILKAIIFLIPGIIALLGIGMAVSSLVLLAKDANSIIDLSNSLLSVFSGSICPIKVFSSIFLVISMLIPLTYLNDSIRAILINQNPIFSLKSEFLILTISMVIFFLGGRKIFMIVDRKCREKGLLSGH